MSTTEIAASRSKITQENDTTKGTFCTLFCRTSIEYSGASEMKKRTIADADRPEPVTGKQASVHYAEQWAASHRGITDEIAYRSEYADILILDRMLSGYSMLDVGCGTGGYLRLCKNHSAITAIDFSQSMIDEALRLQDELSLERISFLCEKFESYRADEKFDVVRMGGVVGWYRPWPGNEDVLQKARDLVRVGGIVIATYVKPTNLIHVAKTILFPRKTIVIPQVKFLTLAAAYGFEHLFSIDFKMASQAFLRRMH